MRTRRLLVAAAAASMLTLTACGAPGAAKGQKMVQEVPPLGQLPDLPTSSVPEKDAVQHSKDEGGMLDLYVRDTTTLTDTLKADPGINIRRLSADDLGAGEASLLDEANPEHIFVKNGR